jgi:hypothetical protein
MTRAPAGEAWWFAGATGVAVVHGLDDAVIHRQPGVPADQHLLAASITVALAAGAAVAFGRLRPGSRSLLALSFGVLALANAGQHVAHIAVDAPARSDVTGVLAAVAGLALLALALWIPSHHRGEGAFSPGRRWANRAVALVAGLVTLYVVVLPVAVAVVSTHKHREPVGAPPSAAYRPVTFAAGDGLRLSGWYVPSRNRAAVVLVHGGGGDRTGPERQAALLLRHGYGVLLYDARGRGASEGSPNQFGWEWDEDVAGAVAFLRRRPEVDRDRLGALGLSTGADVLLDVAARPDDGLSAVVGEGATAESLADVRDGGTSGVDLPYWAVLYAAARVLSGTSPAPALEGLVPRVAPTPLLLIAAGGDRMERRSNRRYAAVGRAPFELWEVPGGAHTGAIRERPAEYERRVIGFFDRRLHVGSAGRPRAGSGG